MTETDSFCVEAQEGRRTTVRRPPGSNQVKRQGLVCLELIMAILLLGHDLFVNRLGVGRLPGFDSGLERVEMLAEFRHGCLEVYEKFLLARRGDILGLYGVVLYRCITSGLGGGDIFEVGSLLSGILDVAVHGLESLADFVHFLAHRSVIFGAGKRRDGNGARGNQCEEVFEFHLVSVVVVLVFESVRRGVRRLVAGIDENPPGLVKFSFVNGYPSLTPPRRSEKRVDERGRAGRYQRERDQRADHDENDDTECTLPPGVIAHLYWLRWEIEKTFDELEPVRNPIVFESHGKPRRHVGGL